MDFDEVAPLYRFHVFSSIMMMKDTPGELMCVSLGKYDQSITLVQQECMEIEGAVN